MARVTKEHLDARKNQILDAAWSCFGRRGYHQTTMQEVATAAGISAGAIYRYYPSKEAVLQAISERALETDQSLITGARAHADEPIDALELLGALVVSNFRAPDFQEKARVIIEMRPELLRDKKLSREQRRHLDLLREGIAGLMADAQKRGQLLPQLDPESLAILSLAVYEGLRAYNLVDPEHFRPERVFSLLRQVLRPEEYRPEGAQQQKETAE
jgi:AcrR family transcriptional regulator